jgi:hypothetical protein
MAINGQPNDTIDPPQDNRHEPGSSALPPAQLPTDPLPDNVDPQQVADQVVKSIADCIDSSNLQGLADLFLEDGYWRDHLCLSWDLRTIVGRDKIAKYLALHGSQLEAMAVDRSAPHLAPGITQVDAHGKSKCVGFFTTVTTKVGTGRGYVRLIHRDGEWKILALGTGLRELKGFEEPRRSRRPKGAEHSGSRSTKNWLETRQSDQEYTNKDPAVLIIGVSSVYFYLVTAFAKFCTRKYRWWPGRSSICCSSQDAECRHTDH